MACFRVIVSCLVMVALAAETNTIAKKTFAGKVCPAQRTKSILGAEGSLLVRKTMLTLPVGGQRVGWWDFLVPMWTWALFAFIWATPSSFRFVPVMLWLMPVFIGEKFKRAPQWMRVLRSVAHAKKLRIVSSQGKPLPHACIVGLHPHGRYPMDIFPWLSCESEVFTDIVVAQSSLGKFVPTVGYITMLSDVVDVTRKNICKRTQAGKQVALFPGGAREMTLCTPFSTTLPLVRHSGFLRVAREQSLEMQQRGEVGPMVVPCFLFGMHDNFDNLLPWVDKVLFNYTGVNLPLWWPTPGGELYAQTMVVGEPLDPLAYKCDEELSVAYWDRLHKLFEQYKSSMPGYAHRTIQWVDTAKPKDAKHDVGTHVNITLLKAFFVIGIVSKYAVSGKLLRLSTVDFVPDSRLSAVAWHILAAVLWSITSAILTIKGYFRYHKQVGYVAVLALYCMSGTGFYLSAAQLSDATLTQSSSAAAHTAFHAFTNMIVSAIVPTCLGYALGAVRKRDYTTHRIFMSMAHIIVGSSFTPRITSSVFRWFFPFLSNDATYSVAAFIQYWMQISVVLNSKLRWPLVAMNLYVFIVVFIIMLLHWSCNISTAVGFSSPILFVVSGFVASWRGLLKKRNGAMTGHLHVDAKEE